jgi:hypothetical protein
MKTSWVIISLVSLSVTTVRAQNTPYQVTDRGAFYRVWQRTNYVAGPDGKQVPRVNKYTELAVGLHYQKSGQWMESKEVIEILPNGMAAAVQGQHQAYFPGNIYNGLIKLVTPDGIQMKSRPLGLSYGDGTNTVLIAELKVSVGQVVGSNEIIYPDAFTDFKADLRYTYTKAGFEQDIVLREQPPVPQAYGLNPQTARLQVLTEFFNSPEPKKTRQAASRQNDLDDTTLAFGTMKVMKGKAFSIGDQEQTAVRSKGIPVAKSWQHWEGRTFLVEELPVQNIKSQLEQLPEPANAVATASSASSMRHKVSAMRLLPPTRLVQTSTNAVRLAKADISQERGLVLDYVAVDSGADSFAFQEGETYVITGPVSFGGATFYGGAVIKFTPEAAGGIDLGFPNPDIQATPDHPVIFTSVDDNSVGEATGTGNPTTLTNVTFLPFVETEIRCFDFHYAGIAMIPFDPTSVTDCRFYDCYRAIQTPGEVALGLNNCLFSRCYIAVDCAFDPGDQWPWDLLIAEYVTADSGTYFLFGYPSGVQGLYDWCGNFNYYFYNCLFTRYPDPCDANSLCDPYVYAVCQTNNASCYQAAGAAEYYLASDSPYHGAGTTNIEFGMVPGLTMMTTFAPQDGGWPDTNGTDIGYHYPTNEDSDYDGLPDWWEWYWFGNFSHIGSERDGQGNTLLFDYQNGLNPSQISFTVRLGNQHFNATNVTGQFLVLGGVPSYEAVLANDTNMDDAVWSNYDGTVHLNLGPADGVYQVWIGLKGHAPGSVPAWIGTEVTLTRTPPQIVITNPTTNVVAQPYLQLQGYSAMPLASVRYDISNAVSSVTNHLGFVTRHTLDTNTLEYTSDYFQCYDILLTNGLNAITLRVTDPAGNMTTTNLSITLNYSTTTNPTIQITWPQDGMKICGNSFTLRGWTEDATAQVAASITDTNGNTNVVTGMVERDGKLWVENLPLGAGTNLLILAVTNTAGLSSVTNIAVVKSDLVLTMNPVTESLWHPWVTVTGYISDATQAVWINGVKATMTPRGDGTADWTASKVPVTEGGVASFDMTAYEPDEQQPDGSYGNGGGN